MSQEKGKRGPDTKPRHRRTKAEILLASGIISTPPKPKPDSAKPNGDTMQSSIQTIALTEAIPNHTSASDASNAMEIARKVTAHVLDSVYADLDKRAKEILSRAEALASTKQVAIAIRINDEPLKKLQKAAHPQLAEIVAFLKLGIKPLLVGPAGCGKTFAAHQAAEALGLPFSHICFTAGVSETWLFGRQTPSGFIEGEFVKAYRDGGLFLADEMDAADPNVLLAINTALANGHLYNPISGQSIAKHCNFHFIGAANTVGKGGDAQYTGRSRLDAATLDRFRIIRVGYDANVEDALCPNPGIQKELRRLRAELSKRGTAEVISYRAFEDAYRLHTLGWSLQRIVSCIAESWSDDTRDDLGVKRA